MSVSHTPKSCLAENTGNVELGAAPLVQHYSVFSARPGLGYGTLIQFIIAVSKFFSPCKASGFFLGDDLPKRLLRTG